MTENEKLDLILSEVQDVKFEVAGMKSEIADMKSEMTDVKSEIADMKSEMTDMKSEIADMKSEMTDMKSKMQVMESDIKEMNQKIIRIDLTMENELRINIQRVAEGHLDLSRNLHKAMKPSNETEMLAIRVGMLETDVRNLKEKIS